MHPTTTHLAHQPRQLLEQIIGTALDAFVVIDARSCVMAWTPQAEALFGWSAQEAIGRSIVDLVIPPELRQAHRAGMQRYLETGRATVIGRRIEIPAQHKTGRIFPIELSINAARIDGQQVFSAAMRDISDRKALQEQYRLTFEKAPVGIAHLDGAGKVATANRKACDILGYSPGELLGMELAALSLPADRPGATAHVQRLLRGEHESAGFELRCVRKDGAVIWLKTNLSLLREPGANQGWLVAVFDDITAARSAHERADQLAAVIEATPDFVGFADVSGQALYVNPAGREMVGIRPDAPLRGVSIGDKYPAWAFDIVSAGIRQALAHGTWRGETAVISGEGREIPTSQVIIAHRDANGQARHISTIIRDIRERYATEQALRELDRRKDEFLAMLAHELRNPLAPIATAAQILKLPDLDTGRVAHTSEIIARQVAHITKLLDDLLDVSRVTRGLITLERERVDMREAVAHAVEQVRPLVEARRHHLAIQTPPHAITVDGDNTRLVQVVVNLLNNAARYTPQGGTIRLELLADGAEAVVRVADNGIGIGSDMLPHVFELFTQARRSPDRSQGGLGLGLALVRKLVELHHGSLTARSAGEGQGSEFEVRLPVLSAAAAAADVRVREDPPEGQGSSELRVMIVDDNLDAAQTLGMLIGSHGHAVVVEHDAREALRRAEMLRPDVLLLDIGLPDIDGYELARRLRARPALAHALLVAVTGYGQSEDVARAMRAGFDHHLLKPADPERLLAILRNAPRAATAAQQRS